MKCKLLIIGFVLFFSLSCYREDRNGIILDPKIYLGKIKSDSIYHIEIKCKNLTHNDIQLKELNVTCGCIRSSIHNNAIIHARDSGIFKLEFLPEGIGYIERVIEFYFKEFEFSYRTIVSAHIK